MDCWLNADSDPEFYPVPENPATDPAIKAKLSQLDQRGSALTFVFIDEDQRSIDDGCMVVGNPAYPVPNAWYNLPSDRHSQGCGISFADGRVERWHWKWPKHFEGHGQVVESALHDAQQCDLQDLRRLQSSIPSP